jgi:phosphoribosyl-ATP pyrophosphohydrolase/phosphoribosyl-AMP cyclohydrolase/histidinol dehydrogenase
MQTLNNRLENPEPKSYTAKLFSDANLLHAKIREEAQELCDAKTKEDIAWETADLFYFALAKCVKNGVSLSDVEEHLNRRAFKVTRRPGHAKPQFLPSATSSQINDGPVNNSSNTSQSKPDSSTEIKLASAKNLYQLKIVQANNLSEEERQQYLKRPIMDTESITSRVVPILEQVKQRGDAALLELTKRFDNVILNNPVLEPPFGPHYATRLDSNVRRAIDVAFDNIYKFHLAQLGPCDQGDGLSVETMPGVVCSRFSRPIERVGLYVPGGSAVLPSTALMLGIPAMVAGCQQIILATPYVHLF